MEKPSSHAVRTLLVAPRARSTWLHLVRGYASSPRTKISARRTSALAARHIATLGAWVALSTRRTVRLLLPALSLRSPPLAGWSSESSGIRGARVAGGHVVRGSPRTRGFIAAADVLMVECAQDATEQTRARCYDAFAELARAGAAVDVHGDRDVAETTHRLFNMVAEWLDDWERFAALPDESGHTRSEMTCPRARAASPQRTFARRSIATSRSSAPRATRRRP